MLGREWIFERDRGHIKRLGPWLVLSLLIFTFVLPPLYELLPERPRPLQAEPVTMKEISTKQWMQNKTVKQNPSKARLAQQSPRPEKIQEKKKAQKVVKPDGQVVDIAMPEKEEIPEESKLVSQYNSKVLKQTKAEKRRAAESVAPKASMKGIRQDQQKPGKSEERLVLTPQDRSGQVSKQIKQSLALIPKLKIENTLELEKEGTRGHFKNRKGQQTPMNGNADRLAMMIERELEKGREGEGDIPRQSNIPKSLLPSLSSIVDSSGMPMNDYLRDIEESEATGLNTRAFKYATFYNRIKRKVSLHWQPALSHSLHDPTYAIYGYQSRYTILHIVLDENGRLKQSEIQRSSGVEFLDREAVSAIIKAAPFPNPPQGIVEEDGTISFPFGFYFEMSRSGTKFSGR